MRLDIKFLVHVESHDGGFGVVVCSSPPRVRVDSRDYHLITVHFSDHCRIDSRRT